jgi:D-alanyl-D-alanine carboxypeptidase
MSMTLQRFGLLVGAACVVVVACGSASDQGRATPGLTRSEAEPTVTTAEPAESLDSTLDEIVRSFVSARAGGVDLLVRRNGETQRVAVGASNAVGEPLQAGQPFRVGSLSKPFVATMILQLVDEGRVDLDAPLGTYLPAATTGATVTIRELLDHRSGIANYTDQPDFFTDVLADPSRRFTPAEIVAYVADAPVARPGSFAYSNTNYILLGQLIEELDGDDLDESLQQRIAGPLGLTGTVFPAGDRATPDGLAAGWSPGVFSGEDDAEYASVATSAWAAGALISTTDDLAAFLHGLFDGELISAGSLQEMTDTGPDGYGLGLVAAALGPAQNGFAHSGAIPGYTSTMAIAPTTGDTLIILTNNDQLTADLLAPQVLAVV